MTTVKIELTLLLVLLIVGVVVSILTFRFFTTEVERKNLRDKLMPLKWRERFSKGGAKIRRDPLSFLRKICFLLILVILFWTLPWKDNSQNQTANSLGTGSQATQVGKSIPSSTTGKLIDSTNQFLSSDLQKKNNGVIPASTSMTTKATTVVPDKSTGSQTTYAVETSSQTDYLQAFMTDATVLLYIKIFLAVVFAVLGSFLFTLPFSKVEQLKFLGFEYKTNETTEAVQVLADDVLTKYRRAEMAKLAAFEAFCKSDSLFISRQCWINVGADKIVHLSIMIEKFLKLLEEALRNEKIIVTASYVLVSNGDPVTSQLEGLKKRLVKDVVLKSIKNKDVSDWEAADGTFIYARPTFYKQDKTSTDYIVVVFHSKDIGFSLYDHSLLDAVQTYIETQQEEFISANLVPATTSAGQSV